MKKLRFVAFLVALAVVFAMFSGFTSTEGANQEPEQEMEPITAQPFVLPDIIEQTEASANGYVGRVTEQENDLYTFVFQNEDGSNTMRVYSDPVKYVDDNGIVRDITTDLEALSDGSFRTADNNVVTTFAKQLSDGITLAYDDIEIKMLPAIPDTASASRFGSAPTASSADGKTVSYAYGNSTTLEYTLTYSGFKEDIVVSEYTGQTEYEFRIETGGLLLTERFGSFYLTDDEGTTRATIGDIIIFTADERNNAFGSLTARTITAGEEYFLTIHIDPEYLRDEATMYPIRIDPTIEITYDNDGAGAIEDVTINSLQGSDGSSGSLFVGKRDAYGISRVLMRFPGLNIESLPGREQINSAQVENRDLMCDGTPLTIACGVFTGNAWTEETASWETVAPGNCILMTSNSISYANGIAQETNHRYAFDILPALDGWLGGYYDQDKGIVFFSNPSIENGVTTAYKTFASYNRSSYKPSLSIEYRTIVAVTGLTPPSIPYSSTRHLTANHAYKYVLAPLTGTYSVWTTGATDTCIYVYEDAALSELLAFDFDAGHGNNSTVTFDAVNGKAYYIIVQGGSESAEGSFTVNIYRGLPLSGSEEENNIALFNNESFIKQTNCYSYALNSLINPVTGTNYVGAELNPGGISGNSIGLQDLLDAETAKISIINAVRADCEAWGGSSADFYEVSAETIVPEGYYKVALLLSPGNDYHWIRQVSDLDGRWAHKSGRKSAKDFDADNALIYVPQSSRFAAKYEEQELYVYTVFLGYYALKPPSAYEATSVRRLQDIAATDDFEAYSLDASVTVASFLPFVVGETTQHSVYASVGLPHDYAGSGFIRDVYKTTDGYYVLLTYRKNNSSEIVVDSIEIKPTNELSFE